ADCGPSSIEKNLHVIKSRPQGVVHRMKLSVSVIIVAVLATTTAATAAQAAPAAPGFPERLDLPAQGLESRVEFWKKVYTQYGEDDVIIHDRIHVNLIYDVAIRDDQTEKIGAVRQAL